MISSKTPLKLREARDTAFKAEPGRLFVARIIREIEIDLKKEIDQEKEIHLEKGINLEEGQAEQEGLKKEGDNCIL